MSSKSSQNPDSKNHGHSIFIKIIVAVLLVGAIAWIFAYTRAVETAPVGTPSIEPGATKNK